MNKKITAMVMAAAFAVPLMMAEIGMAASGKGKGGVVAAAATGSSTKLEAEFEKKFCIAAAPAGVPPLLGASARLSCLPGEGRGEAEVEFEQKTKARTVAGVTTTTKTSKLKAEIETLVPGSTPIDPTTIDPTFMVGGATCNFSAAAKISSSQTVVKNGVTYQKISIEGSTVLASSVPPPVTPPAPTDKGLDCGSFDISTLVGNEEVKITELTIGTTVIPDITGFLALDD